MNVVVNRVVEIIRDAWSTLGPLNGCLYLATRTLERATGGRVRIVKYSIVAQPVPVENAALRPNPNFSVFLCSSDHSMVAEFPRPNDVIAWRFETGAECLVATVKGKFAGFVWLRRNSYEEDEVRCSFVLASPTDCVWDFDVYVDPTYRHGRTMARLWDGTHERLRAHGIRWTCSRISTFNAASLAAHKRMGAVGLHSASFLVLGDWQLALLSRRPFIWLSRQDRSRPRLVVDAPR